ncbi:MarR family winged helix-turn-helix transcriptional regulator [Algoriphagus formosus]|jgi:DNA-binding MarR family transcriptional regulator|uniref:MarR family transcriptional regulator n=2 Tax=Algoriphagus TaxID=246875 RepID=A0A0P7YTM5_9BACT|nr:MULTISPECIES: MarR family transcriptional regulator [Algoriphagus]KPQ18969.1 MAG: MarR family transcriptional regulator [Algoriphagus marincola HL-49]TDK44774.1 MarR family transcriptional regulator [Algoriphagus aquimaris]
MGKLEEAIQQKDFIDPYHKAVVNLLFTHSYVVGYQNALLKPYDLSPEQYNVLRILRGQNGNPTTVSSIQERMLNKMSNASRLVEKLKAKGLVIREECPTDRRQVDVMISAEGLKLLEKLETRIQDSNKYYIKLSESEVRNLNMLLDKLRG